MSLLGDLLGGDELTALAYQPIIELQSGRATGVEALLRWHHPRWGPIGPMQFMPLAEQTDLVSPITRQVLAAALAQAARWRSLGHELLLSVNGSARNLLDLQFPDHVEAFLRAAGIPPESLELEITENAMLGDPTRVRVVLRALQAIGVRSRSTTSAPATRRSSTCGTCRSIG